MKQRYFLIILLVITSFLLTLNIIGYCCDNKLNLVFDSSEFNNIVTPILTIVATFIYAFALFTTIKQNKIALSQNIKPYYLDEIKKFEKKAKKVVVNDETVFPGEKITAENYISYIMKALVELTKNEQYKEDYKNHSKGTKLTNEYIRTRTYYNLVMFLTGYTFHLSDINFLQSEIASLVGEINLSKLIEEDKILLKKQIDRTFFQNYLSFIEFEDKHDFAPQIPILFRRPLESDIYFEKLSQTNFRNLYFVLKKELLVSDYA